MLDASERQGFQYYLDILRGKEKSIRFRKLHKFCKDKNISLKEDIIVNPSNMPIEIVIPCAKKDADILPLAIKGLKENILHPVSAIKVISPDSNKVKEICQKMECDFVDEKDVLPFDLKYVGSGWLYQQFLKMAWCNFSNESLYLVADSDTILIRPISFEYNGKMLIEYSDEFHTPYFNLLKKLDVYVNSHVSFIAHHMLFNKNITKELLVFLEQRRGQKWFDEIMYMLSKHKNAKMSEYELYANFLIKNYPEKVILEYWYNKSFDTANLQNIKELSSENSNDYKAISFHNYNYGGVNE